jgi:hypothetical protein
MFRKVYFLMVFAVVLLLTGSVYAQSGDPANPQHSDPVWQVSYWNNRDLSGSAALTRSENELNWDWNTGSPHSSVTADNFSARWTRYIDVAAGTYRFTATSDDGIRVFVDNQLLINRWDDHAIQTYTADTSLSAGHHLITVEYYEHTGLAVAKVTWGTAASGNQWVGEYYNNRTLSGSPVLVRNDSDINFDWKFGSPTSGIPTDNFSVRWSRQLDLSPGTYRFTTSTDDGVRLWVNDHLLVDQWREQAIVSYSGTIFVSGQASVVMAYYEQAGLAVARLTWNKVSGGEPPPSGGVIVDDNSSGFVSGGSALAWRTELEGYNGRLTWTRNNDYVRDNYNWAHWYPALAAGRYEVFVYIPDQYTTTSSARYWVSHRDGYTLRTVDQSTNGDRWVSLGTYNFRGTGDDYVSLSDVTYEPFVSRLIAFDAVKWEPR